MDPATIGQFLASAGSNPESNFGGAGGGFGNGNFGQGLGNLLSGLFIDQSQPYKDASNTYDRYLDQGTGAFNPFYNQGIQAGQNYSNQLNQMQDPTAFLNNIMGQYQQSPYNRFLQQQGQRAITNNASNEGLIGSTPYQQQGLQFANQMAQSGMDDFLKQILGINNTYLQGQSDIFGKGFGAAQGIGGLYGQAAGNQAGLQYGQSAGSNQNTGNIISGLIGLLGF